MGCIVKTILCGTVLNPLLQEMLEKHFGKLILQYVIRLPAFWLHVSHIILKRHFKNLSDFSSSLGKALMIMSAWRALYLRYLCAYNYNATSSHLLNLFFFPLAFFTIITTGCLDLFLNLFLLSSLCVSGQGG